METNEVIDDSNIQYFLKAFLKAPMPRDEEERTYFLEGLAATLSEEDAELALELLKNEDMLRYGLNAEMMARLEDSKTPGDIRYDAWVVSCIRQLYDELNMIAKERGMARVVNPLYSEEYRKELNEKIVESVSPEEKEETIRVLASMADDEYLENCYALYGNIKEAASTPAEIDAQERSKGLEGDAFLNLENLEQPPALGTHFVAPNAHSEILNIRPPANITPAEFEKAFRAKASKANYLQVLDHIAATPNATGLFKRDAKFNVGADGNEFSTDKAYLENLFIKTLEEIGPDHKNFSPTRGYGAIANLQIASEKGVINIADKKFDSVRPIWESLQATLNPNKISLENNFPAQLTPTPPENDNPEPETITPQEPPTEPPIDVDAEAAKKLIAEMEAAREKERAKEKIDLEILAKRQALEQERLEGEMQIWGELEKLQELQNQTLQQRLKNTELQGIIKQTRIEYKIANDAQEIENIEKEKILVEKYKAQREELKKLRETTKEQIKEAQTFIKEDADYFAELRALDKTTADGLIAKAREIAELIKQKGKTMVEGDKVEKQKERLIRALAKELGKREQEINVDEFIAKAANLDTTKADFVKAAEEKGIDMDPELNFNALTSGKKTDPTA